MGLVINCKQRSPYWYALRSERMTASKGQTVAANGKGLESYILEMMEIYYGIRKREYFQNDAMLRGIELEDSAAFLYGVKTGNFGGEVGFIIHGDYFGGSPDLFKPYDFLTEIKCPGEKAHQKALEGKISSVYKWQMQSEMLITNMDWCHFVSYNPDFPEKEQLKIIKYERDEKMIDKLKIGIESGTKTIQEFKLDHERSI